MTVYYFSTSSGSDTTGNGTAGNPYALPPGFPGEANPVSLATGDVIRLKRQED